MTALPICLRLLTHEAELPRIRAELRAGSKMAARMAIMAMTTRSSIKVKQCICFTFLQESKAVYLLYFPAGK